MKEVGVANSALTVADSTPRLIDFLLTGKNPVFFAKVVNENGPEAADTVLASPAAPVNFFWDDSNSRKDERACWVHGKRVHDFIKNVDPTFTGRDYMVTFHVNWLSGQSNCPGNALWHGTDAHFCAAGGSYENTGEIGDVVYHEYGHRVSQKVYAGFGFSGAMSEGNSDVIANLINEDPIIGDGFFGTCNLGIRNSNNGLVLADTTTHSEIHGRGQIIAGFWWQLRGRLIERHDALLGKTASPNNQGKHLTHEPWHWCRRLMKPNNEVSMVLDTFVVDDDDGNLDNGTPNYQDICDIATAKGFTCPSVTQGVAIAHTALASTTDTTSARPVSITVTSLSAGINPSTVELRYRLNGGSPTVIGPMTNAGGGVYTASIPAQSLPSVVEYSFSAQDGAGNIGYSPTAAQDVTPDTSDAATPPTYNDYHTYDVRVVYDDCEAVGGWTPHAPGSTATGGVWENGSPTATQSQPGHQMTPAGTRCSVTGATTGNVNNGITILLSRVWDLTGKDSVVVKFRRWFVNGQDASVGRFRQDWMITEVSNDSGRTWTLWEATNEGLDSWQEREVDISALFGDAGKIRFRFTVQDTGDVAPVEALVDEVRISGRIPPGTAVDDFGPGTGTLPARFALHANAPNPFNPKTTIRFDLPRATSADLAIFNASGERVRTLASGRRPAGRYEVVWDGRNERGEEVVSSVYLYRLSTPEEAETWKMMLVK